MVIWYVFMLKFRLQEIKNHWHKDFETFRG